MALSAFTAEELDGLKTELQDVISRSGLAGYEFVVCVQDAQGGWRLNPAPTWTRAETLSIDEARRQCRYGVFVLSRNRQHGLLAPSGAMLKHIEPTYAEKR